MIGEWTKDCCLLYNGLWAVLPPEVWKVKETASWGADFERFWTDILQVVWVVRERDGVGKHERSCGQVCRYR